MGGVTPIPDYLDQTLSTYSWVCLNASFRGGGTHGGRAGIKKSPPLGLVISYHLINTSDPRNYTPPSLTAPFYSALGLVRRTHADSRLEK